MAGVVKLWTWLFGKPLTPQQILRRNQRAIQKAIRGIERERLNMEKQEQRHIIEMKRMAQKNQPDAVRQMANDLVRLRNHQKKLLKMKQNLQGVSVQLQTLESHQSISHALLQATLVLRGMNKQLNLPRVQAILREFEKQNQIMGIKEEMINDTMDDVTGVEEDGEESDDIVTQVLDELGLQIGEQLPEAPLESKGKSKASLKGKATVAAADGRPESASGPSVDDELLARLERLRKS